MKKTYNKVHKKRDNLLINYEGKGKNFVGLLNTELFPSLVDDFRLQVL